MASNTDDSIEYQTVGKVAYGIWQEFSDAIKHRE